MSDLIELDVVVKDKGLKASISTVERLERQIIKATKALDQNSSSQVRFNTILRSTKKEYESLGLSSQEASSLIDSFADAQRRATDESDKENKVLLEQIKLYKQARSEAEQINRIKDQSVKQSKAEANAVSRNAAELRKLKSGYDSTYAAQQKRLQLSKALRTAISNKTMTVQEAAREMRNYKAALDQASAGVGNTANKMNAGGMAMQQVGYQVGDFLVQAQSGTNLFVAFGQQATQLVGILPMVATQLGITMSAAIAFSASLGILIPLATAIGAAFMMSKSSSDELSESLDELYSKIDSLNDSLGNNLSGVWAVATEGADNYLTKLRDIAQEKANAAGVEALTKDASIISQFKADLLGGDDDSGLVAQMDRSIQDALDKREVLLGKMTDSLIGEKGRKNNFERFNEEAQDLLKQANAYKDERKEFLNIFEKGTTTEESVIRILALREKYEKSGGDAMLKRIDGIVAELELEGQIKALKEKQVAAAKAEKDAFIEASNVRYESAKKVADAEIEEAVRIYKARMKKKKEGEELDAKGDAAILKRQAQMEIDLFNENQAYEEEQKRLDAAGDLAILNNQANAELELFKANAKYESDQAALRLKEQEELNDEVEKMAERLSIPFERALELIRQAKAEATIDLSAFGGPGSFKHGGIQKYVPGKGPKLTTMEGPIEALERQIELSKALFGLQGRARREEEIYMQLKFQNQDVDIKAGKEQLELLAKKVALEEQRSELSSQAEQINLENISPLKRYVLEYDKLVKLKENGLGDEAFAKEVAKLNEELAKSNPLLNSFTDAFSNFLDRGARDFKSFAKDILNDFKSMLIQMITTAARNKIMFSMGSMGGNGGGSVAGQAGSSMAGSMAGSMAKSMLPSAFGSSVVQGGFAAGASSFGAGVTTSLGLGTTGTAAINGAVAQALSPTMYAIGSLAGPLLAVAAAFSFLRGKTKELDNGLRVTVNNMDVLVKSFKTVEKSRFWGLSKKVRTSEEEVSSDISDPIVNAVVDIQESVLEAASAFGIASDAFSNFTYDFEVSLKGLTEDQKMKKLNEEFIKLGDTFTQVTGLFTNMNDLMAVYQQRIDLEKQLLVAQGDVVKLRELELETIHVLNRDLATRLHLLQAEGDMKSAIASFASGVSEQQGLIRSAVDALVKPLQDAINRTRTQAEKSYSIFKTAADKSAESAKNIVDIITSALDSRTIVSESAELMRYQTAQKQLASFAGGAEFDEDSLSKAAEGVSIDSQKFFGSFEDYARDFYKTQVNLEDLASVAEKELTDTEKQIDIAEKAYEVAMGTYQEAVDFNTALNSLLVDLSTFTETLERNEPFVAQVKDEGDLQVKLFDELLVQARRAVNAELNVADSVSDLAGTNLEVADALKILGVKESNMVGAVVGLAVPVSEIGSHVENLDTSLSGAYTRLGIDLQALINLDIAGSLKKLNFFEPLSESNIAEAFSGVDLTTPFGEVNLATAFGDVNLATAFDGVDLVNPFLELDLSAPFANVDLSTALSVVDLAAAFSTVDLAASFDSTTNSKIGSEIANPVSKVNLATAFGDVNLAEDFNSTTNAKIGSEIADPISSVNLSTLFNQDVDFEEAFKTAFNGVDLTGSLEEKAANIATNAGNLNVAVLSANDKMGEFTTKTNEKMGELSESLTGTDGLSSVIKSLTDAIGGENSAFGNLVSSLTDSLNLLDGANTALVEATEKEASAKKVADLTVDAGLVSESLSSVVVPDVVEVVASNYRSGFLGDKASTATLSTGDVYSTKAGSGDQERLNAVALAQAAADVMNLERQAPLAEQAELKGELYSLNKDILALGGELVGITQEEMNLGEIESLIKSLDGLSKDIWSIHYSDTDASERDLRYDLNNSNTVTGTDALRVDSLVDDMQDFIGDLGKIAGGGLYHS